MGVVSARMETARFNPHSFLIGLRGRGCYTCAHVLGGIYAEPLLCELSGGRRVVGTPATGCAFWMREPGSDDE